MKLPLSWLKEFVTIDAELNELCERLTMAGLEVENIEQLGPSFSRRLRRQGDRSRTPSECRSAESLRGGRRPGGTIPRGLRRAERAIPA